MKLHLSINSTPINGYTNVSPTGGENTVLSRIDNLEGIVDEAECTEILAEDVMDFFPASRILDILKYYTSKLRHGGKIIIGGSDFQSVCKCIITKRLDAVEANKILYGTQNSTWEFKSGMISLDDLTDLLRGLGLKIIHKRLNNCKMCVEAVRP